MAAPGRLVGSLLLGAGVILGFGGLAWLFFGYQEGTTRASGVALGFILLFGCLALPLLAGGTYFLVRGRAEVRDLARVQHQRKLLDIVATRGSVLVSELVMDLNSSRDQVQSDLTELVGRGLFSGYVDWDKGVLYSVEASQLQGQKVCPNCGGQVELVGKGLIKCPYCGAEIFLTG